MAEFLTNTTDLAKVADAIRKKGGTTEPLVYPDGFVSSINNIIMPTYTLVVKTSPSSAITVTKDTKTFSGTADASGECTFSLPEAGVWTVAIGAVTSTIIIGTQELEVSLWDSVFANNTWEQIIAACHASAVPDTWAVKDQKVMSINNIDYHIDIIGKDHDTYADGGTAPITFQMHECYATSGGMSSPGSKPALVLSMMPSEVQAGIRQISGMTKLFRLSEVDIFGSKTNAASSEGKQYEYYKTGGEKSKKYGSNSSTYYVTWWTRSVYRGSSASYCTVNPNGSSTYQGKNMEAYDSFAFCF